MRQAIIQWASGTGWQRGRQVLQYSIGLVTVLAILLIVYKTNNVVTAAEPQASESNFELQFDGIDDRVTVPYDASFPTEVFTASAWIKLPQPARRAAIIARGEDDNSFNLSWQLYVTGNGTLETMLEDANENNYCYPLNQCAPLGTCTIVGDLFVADDAWHHVAVTRNDARDLALYIDGEMRASCEGTGIPSSNNFQDLSIGCTFGTIGPPPGGVEPPTWFFPGLIDKPAMWNVALTDTQITDVFGSGVDPLSSGLLGYWTFNEGTGQAVADLSPAGNDGFLGELPDPDSADPLWVDGAVEPSPFAQFFAQFGDGAALFSHIILFNLDPDMEATVRMILKDNDGNPLSVNLDGELVTGEKTIMIPAGGLRSFKTDGLGDLLEESVTVFSDKAVAGVILFGGPTGLAGVGSSVAQPDGFTAPMETNSTSGINTGIAVMNLEEGAVSLDLQLCDREGAVLASAAAVLPGMGHLAAFLSEFAWSPALDVSDFEGTLKVTADGSIAATVIQTRPDQFATLPVVSSASQGITSLPLQAQEGDVALYFAQFGDGADLFSHIILFNLDPDMEATVRMILKDNDGNPLSVNLDGELVTGEKTIMIPAGGLRSFKTDGLGDLLEGSVTVLSDKAVAGVILFGGPTGLAGVGSSVAQPDGFTAPMETNSTSGINTGIAVMNLEEGAVSLDLQLCDREGAVLASAAAVLPGMGHLAAFLSEFAWSPALDVSDFEGTLKVTADGLIAATVIQTRPGQFATLPVVPLSAPVQTASELVLVNGTILTLDKDDSIVSAVRIREGRIVAVGDDVGGIDPAAQVIDLGGRTVTPGLIDTHSHYFRDAHVPGHLLSAIETVFTIADLLDAVAERAASVPAGEFITVLGRFVAAQFAENRMPTLAELDGAAPNHPVYLHSGFSGPAVTNTMGRVFFEARGVFVNQSGTFSRGQTDPPVQALFADYTNSEALRTVREYMQFSASLGLTTIQNFSGCGGFGGQVRADVLCEGNFFDLWQQGALRVRIRTSAGGFGNNPGQDGIFQVVLSTDNHLQELQDLGGGDDMLRFAATGEFVVGNFGSTSAPFAEAYLQIAERGWSLRQHSISSGENEAHISGFESVNATVSIADLRWAVEHVFVINADHMNRLKEVGAGVTVQDQQYLLGGSGPPYRDLVDRDIPIGGGTDASAISPLSPWISLYHMVTGKNVGGNVINAGQQISRMEALRLYTTGSAYYTFDDEDLGSIEVGKLGDLVVLSDDYLSVPEDEIRTLRSVLTLIGGEVVHGAAEFANLNPLRSPEFE